MDMAQRAVELGEPILQFFGYAHLPESMQQHSRPFAQLALTVVVMLPRNPERTVALRKLLEAKDAAVRAVIFRPATCGVAPAPAEGSR